MTGVLGGAADVPADEAVLDVLTIGETMLALRADQGWRTAATATVGVAGSESNVAIALSRLGFGVSWLSRIGDDEPGARVLRTLRAEGVDVSHVVVDAERPTGVLLFDRAPGGDTRVEYRRAGSAASALLPEDVAAAFAVLDERGVAVRHVHVSGITPALGDGPARAVEHALHVARERGWTTSLDVNFRSRLWPARRARVVLVPLLPYVNLLVASAEELAVLLDVPGVSGGAAAGDGDGVVRRVAALPQLGADWVAVPAGAGPARLFSGSQVFHAAAPDVPVVNPVGAGDAFTAGLISALVLERLGPQEALDRAVLLGACAVSSSGDWEGLPTRADLERLAAGTVVSGEGRR